MNELRTLIDVSAGTRLPHYEQEIFSDLVLAEYYLHKLCEWYDHDDPVSYHAYHYARFVMRSHWPEAEHIIATDPQCAYYYALHVMESRWLEAEPVIATHDVYRMWYNVRFGTNI